MSTISALGIGSGFLNNDLVDDLAEAQRAPVENRLDVREQRAEAQLSALGQIQSAVSEFGNAADALSDPTALRSFEGTSSDSAVGVSVDSEQVGRGNFSVEVNQIAQAQSLATANSFEDRDSTAVGTGELTFQVGEETATITLDEDNNTLNGLANAINEGDFGVSASILDTGEGFRLTLNADDTGVANAISVTADGDGDLERFNFNDDVQNLTETREARDAQINIDGIDISRASNTIEGVIDGVTFDINSTTDGAPAQVSIQQDLEGPAERVNEMVNQFNALQNVVTEFTEFDPDAEEGSLLTGDSAVRTTMNQIRRELGQVVSGLEGSSVRSLADVGITTDFRSGQLQFNQADFQQQLQENPDDVTALFANQGRTNDPQVEFVRSTSSTQAGEFDINVQELATRGSFTGDTALANDITIDETNNTFSLTLNDGNTAEIELEQGTFDRQGLVDQIQAQISDNSVIQASGDRLLVDLTGDDRLQLTSDRFGSESSVDITSASAEVADTLGLTERAGETGTDAVGTIDGQEARGDGQVLFLQRGQGDASGIQVRVTGGETGNRGTVSFIEGVGGQLNDLANSLSRDGGALAARDSSLQSELDSIQERRQDLDDRITSFRERLVSQFTSADARISEFEQTGNFLQQQLASLTGNNN